MNPRRRAQDRSTVALTVVGTLAAVFVLSTAVCVLTLLMLIGQPGYLYDDKLEGAWYRLEARLQAQGLPAAAAEVLASGRIQTMVLERRHALGRSGPATTDLEACRQREWRGEDRLVLWQHGRVAAIWTRRAPDPAADPAAFLAAPACVRRHGGVACEAELTTAWWPDDGAYVAFIPTPAAARAWRDLRDNPAWEIEPETCTPIDGTP